MAQNTAVGMGRYRALMTDTDRSYVSGEGDPSDTQRHQSVYRVRQRINEELPREIELLAEHRPDLLGELRAVVCDGEGVDVDLEEALAEAEE